MPDLLIDEPALRRVWTGISTRAPSTDAFLYRLKVLDYDEAYSMMSSTNNALIDMVTRKGILKKRAIVAIDYTINRPFTQLDRIAY